MEELTQPPRRLFSERLIKLYVETHSVENKSCMTLLCMAEGKKNPRKAENQMVVFSVALDFSTYQLKIVRFQDAALLLIRSKQNVLVYPLVKAKIA